jgi:hypothetical protein
MNSIEARQNFRFVIGNIDPGDATNERMPAVPAAENRELLDGQGTIFQTRNAGY